MIKKTPLYNWHKSAKANLAQFGGYEMPLWYPEGVKKEHIAVITKAGIFDTSHMAVITLKGAQAFDLLQKTFTKNLSECANFQKEPLKNGQCVYGIFLNEKGETLDDSVVYRFDKDRFMIVVNAGMGALITKHLMENSNGLDCKIKDLTDKIGKIDIQGVNSAKILLPLLKNGEKAFDNLKYFTFKGSFLPESSVTLKDGSSILLSRTGYTGEFGFELFMQSENLLKVWEMLIKAGKDFDLTPCGLAARDSLRAGAVLPLSHQDIGGWKFINNPWIFALPYNKEKTEFTKDFIGKTALSDTENKEYTYPFAGYNLRKIPALSKVYDANQEKIGTVLTCATDIAIDRNEDKIFCITSKNISEKKTPKGLSCGFVKVNRKLNCGDKILLSDNKRKIKAEIVEDIRPNRTARIDIKGLL
ncbi:MAG: aminomethyl transferase family protein [Deltaproteobacteria bacterium]|nr:aminomethyl transferase family protein [Deltaproteobacteria bacterium]